MAKSEKTVIELDAEIAQLKKQREAAVKVLGNRIAEALIKKRGIKSLKGFNDWLKEVEALEEADAKAKADIKAEIAVVTDPANASDAGQDPTDPLPDVDGSRQGFAGFGAAGNSQQ